MHVACCQLNTVWEDKTANFAKARALLDAAEVPEGALVVLPEMFATGFSMNVPVVAEGEERPTEAFLAEVAEARGVYVLGGVVTRGDDGRGRNEAVLFGPDGRERARYQKMHPFSFGGETNYYAPGSHPVLARVGEWTLAPFVCYDLRFPEAFRSAGRRGAELFVVIANWPQARIAHWIALLVARAIENQAYVVGVNRVGDDPQLTYPGRSLVVDPQGNVIADAGSGEGVLQADLDRNALLAWRRAFPAIADIHPDYVPTPRS
jgi:predicted amidohydrolase